MDSSPTNVNTVITYEEIIQEYVRIKMKVVRFELILDALYMAETKDAAWSRKKEEAQYIYDRSKEQLGFMDSIFRRMRDKEEQGKNVASKEKEAQKNQEAPVTERA